MIFADPQQYEVVILSAAKNPRILLGSAGWPILHSLIVKGGLPLPLKLFLLLLFLFVIPEESALSEPNGGPAVVVALFVLSIRQECHPERSHSCILRVA